MKLLVVFMLFGVTTAVDWDYEECVGKCLLRKPPPVFSCYQLCPYHLPRPTYKAGPPNCGIRCYPEKIGRDRWRCYCRPSIKGR